MTSAVIDRLSAQDLQILRLEAGPVRGHSGKVLVLEGAGQRALPSVADLRAAIAARLGTAPRLRQRLVTTPLHVARPAWADDPEFDINCQVTPVETAGPVSRAELERIAANLMARRLDRSRPLWHLDVIEELTDGGMALIWRLHHCMADGNTAMHLASAVLWSQDATAQAGAAQPWVPQRLPGRGALFLEGLRERGRRLAQPRFPAGITTPLASPAALTRELSRTAAVTALAREAGCGRSASLIQAPLAGCKRAGKAISEPVTLNDVLLAIIAGGPRA